MTASQIHQRAIEIDDQNRRMTGLVVAEAIGFFGAILSALLWIY